MDKQHSKSKDTETQIRPNLQSGFKSLEKWETASITDLKDAAREVNCMLLSIRDISIQNDLVRVDYEKLDEAAAHFRAAFKLSIEAVAGITVFDLSKDDARKI
ncbi:hypothetical protein GCM10007094_23770 [Pseudovibrio japonicus]|uniref:Uncharacterized protein n=1 Tax=Pseudovibrio japonicus TaxID=366534 RepID=A0ABQ3EDA0_9HYPH|nr:hypothetical protein [Pseudovibrio japonicus]GHB34017.1 hypothetical protein GCM10007094_23770 [Pseudovibrio japonicus]